MGVGVGGGISACCTDGGGGTSGAGVGVGAGGTSGTGAGGSVAGPSPIIISTVGGPDALVGGGVGGIVSKDTNTVRCSASDSQIGQPSVLRRRCATRTVR